MKINNILFTCLVSLSCINLCLAQVVEEEDNERRTPKKIRLGYELKIGNYTNEYTAISPAFVANYVLQPKIWLGIRFGPNHISKRSLDEKGALERENIFLNRENKIVAAATVRYYFFEQKRLTPLMEGRAGVHGGDESGKTHFTTGGSLGLAVRLRYGGVVHAGYYTDMYSYDARAYRTDGTGHTVYRLFDSYPVRRMSHGVFVNFTFF